MKISKRQEVNIRSCAVSDLANALYIENEKTVLWDREMSDITDDSSAF